MGVESPEAYCRQVEAYLCRKNDGHLIRIVGPAFEQVTGWAIRGVPLTVAFGGIDRYFDRYYSKGPRRRPVRIEFCEADVLDLFDQWRRAVGITRKVATGATNVPAGTMEEQARRGASLPAHVDRVIARLTTLRGGGDRTLDALLDAIIRELDAARASIRRLRGDARHSFIGRLRQLDAELVTACRAQCPPATMEQLRAEADSELAPFRERMPSEAFARSRDAAVDRLIRERNRLPMMTFD